MPIHRGSLSLAALLLIAAAPAFAQSPGTISGTVRDPSGAGMSDVVVTLARGAGTPSTTTTTDAQGRYVFSIVPVGTYTLSFTLDGFKRVTRPNVIVTAGFVAHIDQRMEPWCVTGNMAGTVFRAGGDADNFRSTVAFGMICGTVTDPSGAGVAGVAVTLARGGGTQSAAATTNAKGLYWFPNVSEGTYSLTFVVDGFKKSVQPNVILTVGSVLRVDQRIRRENVPESGRAGVFFGSSTGARLRSDS